MAPTHTDAPTPGRPLRLWPGVAGAVLLCLFWFVIPKIQPDAGFYTFIGAMVTRSSSQTATPTPSKPRRLLAVQVHASSFRNRSRTIGQQ